MTYSFDILPFFCSPFAIAHPFCVFTTEVADSSSQLNLFHEFIKTWIETLDKIDIAIKAMKRAEDILCLFARSLSPSWNPSSTLSKFSHPTAPFSGTIFYLGANRILHITLFLRPSFCLYFCPVLMSLSAWRFFSSGSNFMSYWAIESVVLLLLIVWNQNNWIHNNKTNENKTNKLSSLMLRKE